MLKLTRTGSKVYYTNDKNETIELKINEQRSKGANNEVVDISQLKEANGQKWLSLSKLVEGDNEVACKARKVVASKKYELTKEEKDEIDELQSRIDEIIEIATKRYVARPNLNVDVNTLTEEEKDALIAQLESYLKVKKS